ncbi:MAG: nucleotidyltransferase domain-containing protein [Actinobacteria bacterium]|nr:nucleotidyltransferase domain-containing protein [Actinomycetota bacterium]
MNRIFSTSERIKILNSIILNKNPLSVNSVAFGLKLSKGLVSKYFDVLKNSGIVKRSNGKYLILDSGVTKAIRILLVVSDIDISIFTKYNFVKSVGLYGSCSKGENTEESDIDIWIVVDDVGDEKIASLTSEINKKINRAKPLFLTEKKLEKIKKDDELFYHSLSFGSIVLFGEKDAI